MIGALIGGMDRLKQEYIVAAKRNGVSLKVFTGKENSLSRMLGDYDMMIILTGKVSHNARNEAMRHAKCKNIPVHLVHSCGLSSVEKCIGEHKCAQCVKNNQ